MKDALLKVILLTLIIIESVYIGSKIPQPVFDYPVVDSDLRPYLNEFIIDAKNHGIELDPSIIGVVAFTELPAGIIGFCNGTSPFWEARGIRRAASVLIAEEFKGASRDDYAFKALMYHEFAHCLLYKQHDPDEALTIMSTSPTGDPYSYEEMMTFYEETWDSQLMDLFLRPSLKGPPSEEELRNGILENILPTLDFSVPEGLPKGPILYDPEVR